ncbi:MAG: glutamyl-tRNA reductase [Candidatus Rifleibacteriota bacterium]
MPLILFGLNHKTAPITVREKIARLCGTKLEKVDGANLEAVPVFTCNRAEFYFSGSPVQAKECLKNYLSNADLSLNHLAEHLYELYDECVIRHLFSVASGLDSMILGENQILHQIKESYTYSCECSYTGKHMHSLFQKALEVGKKVRTETGISENRLSIASTAVELAGSIFGELKKSTALIIGAGEMANLVAVHLIENNVKELVFVNRTLETAQKLADKFSGKAAAFSELESQISVSDIVISSTAAPHTVIKKDLMEKVMPQRAGRPMFIIDIAVPRDVEPDCENLTNLYLYDIDDLQNVVDENLSQRKIEAEKAEAIIKYEASSFKTELQAFTVVPIIKALREKAEIQRSDEFDRMVKQNPQFTSEQLKILEQHTINLMNKWLHQQIVGLKKQGSADIEQLKLITEVLGLPETCIPNSPVRSLPDIKKESA